MAWLRTFQETKGNFAWNFVVLKKRLQTPISFCQISQHMSKNEVKKQEAEVQMFVFSFGQTNHYCCVVLPYLWCHPCQYTSTERATNERAGWSPIIAPTKQASWLSANEILHGDRTSYILLLLENKVWSKLSYYVHFWNGRAGHPFQKERQVLSYSPLRIVYSNSFKNSSPLWAKGPNPGFYNLSACFEELS